MAFALIAEAVARIEHKLDLILKSIKYDEIPDRMPMSFTGHACPVCDQLVQYQVDLANNVVARRCQCTTGKLAPTTPLFPAAPIGDPNARPVSNDRSEGEGNTSRRHRR